MPYEELLALVNARSGHFAFESGHHSDGWLDLETICRTPGKLDPFITALADRLAAYRPEVICGPMVEGAFVGLMVAAKMRLDFVYAARFAPESPAALFSVKYRIPPPLRSTVAGTRVAVVNDFISAGSAVRGAFEHLQSLSANIVAFASLAVLGDEFLRFAAERKLPVEALLQKKLNLWEPAACPLCAQGVRLEHPANA
ncbi:MAG: hypothetical protein ABIP12_03480 [Terriglobales bacterium]